MLKKANDWLTGFRTILTLWAGWILMYLDVLVGGLTGFNKEALKGAAAIAALTTVKQIKTDVIPRIRELFIE